MSLHLSHLFETTTKKIENIQRDYLFIYLDVISLFCVCVCLCAVYVYNIYNMYKY